MVASPTKTQMLQVIALGHGLFFRSGKSSSGTTPRKANPNKERNAIEVVITPAAHPAATNITSCFLLFISNCHDALIEC